MKNNSIFLVGAPCSGKTTFAKAINLSNTNVVSCDFIDNAIFSSFILPVMDKKVTISKNGKDTTYDNIKEFLNQIIDSIPKSELEKLDSEYDNWVNDENRAEDQIEETDKKMNNFF